MFELLELSLALFNPDRRIQYRSARSFGFSTTSSPVTRLFLPILANAVLRYVHNLIAVASLPSPLLSALFSRHSHTAYSVPKGCATAITDVPANFCGMNSI
jgi:hypothetical protein